MLRLRSLCLAGLVLLTFAGTARAAGATGWAGTVRAPGGPYLTDGAGRRLQLHGADLVAKCGGGAAAVPAPGQPCLGPVRGPHLAYVLSPTARDPGRRFTAADARTVARLGFNVVRLGVIWEGLEPGPRGARPDQARYCASQPAGQRFPNLGAADPFNARVLHAYLVRTGRIVRLLARAGIRVILDMHQDSFGSAFANRSAPIPWNAEGAPPWATCTDGKPFVSPLEWQEALAAPPVAAAVHHLFAPSPTATGWTVRSPPPPRSCCPAWPTHTATGWTSTVPGSSRGRARRCSTSPPGPPRPRSACA